MIDEIREVKATARRVKKASERGDSPRSREFAMAFSLLAVLLVTLVFGKYFLGCIRETVASFIGYAVEGELDGKAAAMAFGCFVRVCVPYFAVLAAVTWMTEVSQVGFVFVTGEKRKMGKKTPSSGWIGGILSLLRTAAVTAVVFLAVKSDFNRLAGMTDMMFTFVFVFRVLLYVGILLVISASADYLIARFLHKESLRMTRRELSEEQRDEMGDPAVKARLDERMKQLLS